MGMRGLEVNPPITRGKNLWRISRRQKYCHNGPTIDLLSVWILNVKLKPNLSPSLFSNDFIFQSLRFLPYD